MRIRQVREDELDALREIERAAGAPFRELGMHLVADGEPMSVAELDRFRRAGTAWVVTSEDRPVGYLVAEPVDGELHIAQVSVHPDAARRGLGRELIEHADRHAVAAGGFAGMSLTTYVEVPWNGPYYRRLGFTELPESRWGPGVRAIREAEAAAGLDLWSRAVMTRGLGCSAKV
ncbi:GNAT family N-acetyltransferase [Pseudonocardia eucalypti]|uniref:GNAT family N-acetyltransferase n=1 Tax=Pseudonocardia eucalypti TaxID=648755 RepID=A0ABP9R255_9PSEU|nr:ribosomal protein S18 acetylase RimI-like enzyme [Pseudonocardia eucalypti]